MLGRAAKQPNEKEKSRGAKGVQGRGGSNLANFLEMIYVYGFLRFLIVVRVW